MEAEGIRKFAIELVTEYFERSVSPSAHLQCLVVVGNKSETIRDGWCDVGCVWSGGIVLQREAIVVTQSRYMNIFQFSKRQDPQRKVLTWA